MASTLCTRKLLTCGLALSAVLLSPAVFTVNAAQAPAAPVHPPDPKPVNLKVLPKDIDPHELHEMMHGYTADLGVKCGFCHAPSATGKGTDFASDAKPEKAIARYMITMTDAINKDYIAKAMPGDAKAKVTCATCHRGSEHPPAFVPPAPTAAPGAPAAAHDDHDHAH